MTSGHILFIPGVMMVGMFIGFVLGTRAARNQFDLQRRRDEERERAEAMQREREDSRRRKESLQRREEELRREEQRVLEQQRQLQDRMRVEAEARQRAEEEVSILSAVYVECCAVYKAFLTRSGSPSHARSSRIARSTHDAEPQRGLLRHLRCAL